MPWFVVLTEPLNNNGKITAYVKYYPSVTAAEHALNEQDMHPYATEQEAQAAANKYNGQPASKKTAANQPNIPTGTTKGVGFLTPMQGIDRIGTTLESFYRDLTDGKMWRSLGWIALGVVLIFAGLFMWLKGSFNVIPIPV